MTTQTCVLVTGVGGRSVGHQILHGLLIQGAKYTVVACDANPFSYGLYQVKKRYRVPHAESPDYLDALTALIAQENIDIVLPGTEPEVRRISAGIEQIKSVGCTAVVNPFHVVELCANKATLYAWLTQSGYDVPASAPASEWKALSEAFGFPLIAKPTLASGGSKNVALLSNEAEVMHYLANLAPGMEVIVQQYVHGPESEYTVGVMISQSGEVIDSIVMRRILTGLSLGIERTINHTRYAVSTGYSQGYIIKNPEIQAECEKLALKIGARGPLNVQCRLSAGKLYIFEVHPRFSGTSSFRADVGFNEPDVLIRNFHFGERIGRIPYQTNMAAIRALSNLVVPVDELEGMQSLYMNQATTGR